MTVLAPMTDVEYSAFVADSVPAYAADKVAAGQWSEADALDLAQKSFDELLPKGLRTPDNHLYSIRDAREGLGVGMVWIAAQDRAGQRIAYVYDVSVKPEHQRQGHATRAFLALEEEVHRLGLKGIALHVFGHNVAAQTLYRKLGYTPTNINMYKPIVR
jgi:ribosomal protein S18 acetylase RimI-like enzyme